jgi:ParB-like chromosome segregation protein Spo0J
LIDQHGWDQKQLAAELCISEGTVSNSLKLLKLDEDTQARGNAGEIKATVAISSARKSRSKAASKSKKPTPMNIRAAAGKVIIEPKAGKTYEEVFDEALTSLTAQKSEAAWVEVFLLQHC